MCRFFIALYLVAISADSIALSYQSENFTIEYEENVPYEVIEKLASRVEENRKVVLGFLNRSSEYNGTPIKESLVVHVSKTKRTPYQHWNTIHIPEKRVLAAFAKNDSKDKGMAVIHELTHVYAVSAYRKKIKNGHEDRFYDDGLAVYLQHEFGEKPEYPDFGTNLYRAVYKLAEKYGSLIPLAKAEDVRHASKSGVGRQLAYLQEGAFTNFLIENYGLSAYLKIYNGASPKSVTGKSFSTLETEWQNFVSLFADN
ncbi:hypothetical protein OPS25_11430 [Alteromonas ponticola]|uniref:Peptidase MA-like domain-containing protein n=1 Tax=Alteromonas aquimaris TaxID=2998417 RepID=A0ABT3P8K8_9ALTE|nr:hypothetical protein [Alteromonas aquimaris]MCW8109108.1 hypothetical protein [Alteromonas aquimaris]